MAPRGAGAPGDTAEAAPPATPPPEPAQLPLRLELNLPAYRLDVLESGAPPRSYPVAIGMPEHPTPVGDFAITDIVWNPWWHPPDREWARGDTITPPCPANPMGRVKLYFLELYYLHGTPAEESVGHALSHGCVRLANPDAIAVARVVHRHGSPDVPASVLDRLEREPRRTRTIRLADPIPLRIVYELAEVKNGALLLHPDVYELGREEPLEGARRALAAAGAVLAPERVSHLRELTARAAHQPVEVPLHDLARAP